jgi:endonuclease/exonuclease/phosphatase family metal-dependent hydrolase
VSFYPPLRDLPEPKRKRASEGLIRLKDSFGQNGFPQKRVDGNLLLATWNIREFGGNKYGGRDDEPLYYLAEIISQFDLVALQEIRDDLADLQRVMQILGGWWKVLFTDVTAGKRGNKERNGFLYDSRKIIFGGLAGEIVLPPIEGNEGGPSEQLARTPMIVGFRAGWFKFTICTAHLYYGASQPDDPRRLQEIRDLAKFLAAETKAKTAWAKNMILLGDFNIFKTTDKTFKALTDNGFTVPPGILEITSNVAGGKHFDQIAFVAPGVQDQFEHAHSGVFKFSDYVYRDADEAEYRTEMGTARYKDWRTYKMSDHFPLWVELLTDFGRSYLLRLAQG